MSKAAEAANVYSAQEITRFTSRVRLTDVERDLLQAMFALAWQEGYHAGVLATSAALNTVLSASIPPEQQR